MTRQIIRLNRLAIYLVLGILIITFRSTFVYHLSLIVGVPMLVLAVEGLLFEIASKSYYNENNHFGSEILRLILSLIIIFALDDDILLICIIWGILVIVTSTRELNATIFKYAKREHILLNTFSFLQAVLQITFAVLLIIDPEEHVDFHLILLGIEMILEAIRMLLSFISANVRLRKEIELRRNPQEAILEDDNDFIAYCGLDCEKCDAYLATINDDNELRIKVAKLWSELNHAEITPEMINCLGCRRDGVKTPYCESLCEIRKCAIKKPITNCGQCKMIENCEKIKMIAQNDNAFNKDN